MGPGWGIWDWMGRCGWIWRVAILTWLAFGSRGSGGPVPLCLPASGGQTSAKLPLQAVVIPHPRYVPGWLRLRGGGLGPKGFSNDYKLGEIEFDEEDDESSCVAQFPPMGSLPPDPSGRTRVPVDRCLCGAVEGGCGEKGGDLSASSKILVLRGYHNRVDDVMAASKIEIDGEESIPEEHGEVASERIHEGNKKRKIELIYSQTRHAMVCCRSVPNRRSPPKHRPKGTD